MKIRSLRALNKLFLVFALMIICQSPIFADQRLPKEKIIKIAQSKASELGYHLDSMSVTYDEGNEMFKKHLRQEGVSEYNKATKEWKPAEGTVAENAHPKLKDQDYQAVYFCPKPIQMGGDLWVFVDRKTGEVLDSVGGE